jgi:hypothetical protein
MPNGNNFTGWFIFQGGLIMLANFPEVPSDYNALTKGDIDVRKTQKT